MSPTVYRFLSQNNRKKQKKKGELETSLVADDTILFLTHLKDFSMKLRDLVNTFSKLTV